MSKEAEKPTLPPMSDIDFDFLKEQYTEFLSLVGKPEQEQREGIIRLLNQAKARKAQREPESK